MRENTVFLIRNVAPDLYGGGETYQLMLANQLKKNGFHPYILTASKKLLAEAKKQKIDSIEAPYINRQNWSGWRNILLLVYYIKILKLERWYTKIMKKYTPVVVNIQSRDDWIAATKVAHNMGIKVIWTDHMDLRSWVLTNVNVWYKNLIGKWVLRRAKMADKIVMISDFEREQFEKNVSSRHLDNVVTIKNGVIDKEKDYRTVKSQKNSFVYVGRVVDYKGIKELVEAFDKVREKYPDIVLNIYGEGDIEKYKKIAGDGVIFHGRTDEPLKVLAENDVFVLPSYREGLSLSLLDAVMMGKIIIASDVDGNPEVVINKKTGLLVPVRNTKKLADAMMYVIEHSSEAKKMAGNARKYYVETYDFEKIFVNEMLPLYRR